MMYSLTPAKYVVEYLFSSVVIVDSELRPTRTTPAMSLSLLLAVFLYTFTLSNGFSPKSGILRSFYRMVDRFQRYSDDEIARLENERLRHLVLGGRDALTEPRVVTAFAILYEDVLPVRFGGDILFNLLDKAINNARVSSKRHVSPISLHKQENGGRGHAVGSKSRSVIKCILALKAKEEQSFTNESDKTKPALYDSLFYEIDANDDGRLSFEEFEAWVSSIPLTGEEENRLQNEWDPHEVFQEIDLNSDGTISHEEFKLWTTGVLGSLSKEECPRSALLELPVTPKTAEYRRRYLEMLRSFNEWERGFQSRCSEAEAQRMLRTRSTPSKDRVNHVIEGCFAGAKNPGVVKALGILYEDYLPLRLAGDTVFKLIMSRMDREVYQRA